MNVRRLAAGAATTAVAAAATGLFASSAFAADTTTIKLDLAGFTSSACPSVLPIDNTIALKSGTPVSFEKGLLTGILTVAAKETVTITKLDATGKPVLDSTGKPVTVATDQAVPSVKPLALPNGSYKLDWKALNLLGIVQGTQTGTLVLADNATTACGIAISLPTPQVSIPGVAPVNSAVNQLVGGVVGGVNSAVAPVGGVLAGVPGVGSLLGGGKTPGSTSGGSKGSTGGVGYKPWTPSLADGVVPDGYGSGSGTAFDYVPPLSTSGLDLASQVSKATAAATAAGAFSAAPVPTTSASNVDLAASKNRGILDSLSGVFVVLAFAALSGAIAYYVRNILLADGGRFI